MASLGYTKDSFYRDEGGWTKGGYIDNARDGCFWRNARLRIPNEMRLLTTITELMAIVFGRPCDHVS
jgi:hypothetical protein